MKIKEWLEEVIKNNFPSEDRQKELAWKYWNCSDNIIDGINRKIQYIVEKLDKDIIENYTIELWNELRKENYGGTYTFIHLIGNKNILITKQDFTMMYKYNVYEGNTEYKHIIGIEEELDLVKWLNENL